jgi:YD repeat-containing protein
VILRREGSNTFHYHYRPNINDTEALNHFVTNYDFASTNIGVDFFVENSQGDTLLAYDYDDLDNLQAIIYEDGSQQTFTYGSGNTTVTLENPDGSSSIQTGSNNEIATTTLPSGIEIHYTYNDSGQEDLRKYYDDSLGNLRSATGASADVSESTGGDFRFQG